MQTSFIVRRSLHSLHLQRGARYIHNTPVFYKKKDVENALDDLFSTESSGTLFEDEPSQQPQSSPTRRTVERKRLTPEERQIRYDSLFAFVKPRIGRRRRCPEIRPVNVKPQVRNSAWMQLVSLSTKQEQLQEIAEHFPAWKDSGREFNGKFSELFVRRCEEVSCPNVAIDVFGNYAKYSLKLTLPAARQLLHSVHLTDPRKAYVIALLYKTYGLPEISEDPVSFSMLLTALFKENSNESVRLAKRFVPDLKQLLVENQRQPLEEITTTTTNGQKEKWDSWLKWSLKKVDKALFVKNGSRGEDVERLEDAKWTFTRAYSVLKNNGYI